MFKLIAQIGQEEAKSLKSESLDTEFEKADFLEEAKGSQVNDGKVEKFRELNAVESSFLREMSQLHGYQMAHSN